MPLAPFGALEYCGQLSQLRRRQSLEGIGFGLSPLVGKPGLAQRPQSDQMIRNVGGEPRSNKTSYRLICW